MSPISQIVRDILIEDLVNDYPFAAHYLSMKGIRCIVCGEPVWGTLEEAAKEKGFNDAAIDEFVRELKQLAANSENYFRNINEKTNPA
jgi:iron-sulfur cluster repair protein YtfE (RIC family)